MEEEQLSYDEINKRMRELMGLHEGTAASTQKAETDLSTLSGKIPEAEMKQLQLELKQLRETNDSSGLSFFIQKINQIGYDLANNRRR